MVHPADHGRSGRDRLAKIDLNLLVALHALIQERNVTRAAARLSVTTSAMSKTLNRLKDVLGDPLFERAANGLILTQRVEELALPLASMLAQADRLVFPAVFDPRDVEDTISISIPEIFAAQIVSRLLASFSANAPKLRLSTRNIDDHYVELLSEGQLDYVLYQQEERRGLRSIPIGWHRPVLMMRRGHPLVHHQRISEERFFSYPHIVFRFPRLRYHEIDGYYRILEEKGEPVWETNQLFAAIETILTTDSLMIGSSIPLSTELCGPKIVTKPLATIEGFDTITAHMHLTFHERMENSPLHQWFVGQMREICALVLPKPPEP